MKQKLTDAEWKVMTVLWERAPRTMMELTNALKEDTGWSKYTVMSFLKRMEEKGALHYEDGGRAKLYYPDWKREDVVIQETEAFLKKVFHGKIGLMVNAMVQQKALSDQEIEELYEILQESEAGKTEVEGRKTGVEGQKMEVEGQKTGVEGRKMEVEGQKTGVEGQKMEVEGQKMEAEGRKTGMEGPE